MKLVRVDVGRFRLVREQAIEWHPITVLFGPNDCGKTSVLDAIDRTLGAVGGDLFQDVSSSVTIELDDLRDGLIDRAMWDQIAREGSMWIHSERRLADAMEDGDHWFLTSAGEPLLGEDPTTFLRNVLVRCPETRLEGSALDEIMERVVHAASRRES